MRHDVRWESKFTRLGSFSGRSFGIRQSVESKSESHFRFDRRRISAKVGATVAELFCQKWESLNPVGLRPAAGCPMGSKALCCLQNPGVPEKPSRSGSGSRSRSDRRSDFGRQVVALRLDRFLSLIHI